MRQRVALFLALALAASLLAASPLIAATVTYQYDTLDRLIQVSYEEGTVIQYSYDPAGNRTQRVVQASATNLSNGQPINHLSGLAGSAQSYSLDVPTGASSLTIRIAGGVGDIALYVRFNALATDVEYDCYQVGDSAELTCVIANPQAGIYFVTVVGVTDFSGVSLRATYSTENSYVCTTGEDFILTNGPLPGETLDVQGCRTITVDAGAAFGATSRLVLAASERIRFAPGFRIEAGGRLSAAMGSDPLSVSAVSSENESVTAASTGDSVDESTASMDNSDSLTGQRSDSGTTDSTTMAAFGTDGAGDAPLSATMNLASICAEPPLELAAMPSDQSVQLTWSAVPEGDRYYAYWSLAPGIHPYTAASYLGFAAIDDGLTYKIEGLENDQEHYFVVTVSCESGESLPSAEVAATPAAAPEILAGRYRLDDIAEGTAEDVVTRLQWMRCALGQQWDGQTCAGYGDTHTYESALNAADTFNAAGGFGGFTDWRAPTLEELQSLVYCSSGEPEFFKGDEPESCLGSHGVPTLEPNVFPESSVREGWFWSATPNDPYHSQGWGVDFIRGDSYAYPTSIRGGLRLVRLRRSDDE